MSDSTHRVTLKGAFHGLIAISGWTLFVFWWNRVLPQIDSKDAVIALVFISGTVLITVISTIVWVRYNIGIFRRKGPRRNLTHVSENHGTDFLGRRIEPPGSGSLKTARLVIVSLEGDVKKYEATKG